MSLQFLQKWESVLLKSFKKFIQDHFICFFVINAFQTNVPFLHPLQEII